VNATLVEGEARSQERAAGKPALLFFHSATSGRCRRVEGFLAQVLQRRGNHGTFALHRIEASRSPRLCERFAVDAVPALVVVEAKRVRARLDRPCGAKEIQTALAPWLH
jgi:thioredoxin-like negative regulator of GroEL